MLPLWQCRVNRTNAGPGKLTDSGAIRSSGQATTAVNASFDQHEAQRMATTTANGRNGQKPQPVAHGTAVYTPAQPTVNGHGRANTQPLVGPVGPVYGDETAVDTRNRTEVETF